MTEYIPISVDKPSFVFETHIENATVALVRVNDGDIRITREGDTRIAREGDTRIAHNTTDIYSALIEVEKPSLTIQVNYG